ncbi:MAG: hypothetical protein D6729_08425 [Deltaproteobacteria bacterium]|nr:MAG: hypothetical protein D6729_08425 [Deltaproteobacteria bacterium]
MTRWLAKVFAVVVLAPTLAACGGGGNGKKDGGDPDGGVTYEPTYESISSNILRGCAASKSCHAADNLIGEVVLDPATAYPTLLNQETKDLPGWKYVVPGDPDSSYLYLKITGDYVQACAQEGVADCGERMPLNGELPQAALDAVRDWILAGAPETSM